MPTTLTSLDTHDIHVVTTYYPDYADEPAESRYQPWGYEVYGPRFVREEAAFHTRQLAEQAGLIAGNEELKRSKR